MQLKCKCPKCSSMQQWPINDWPKLTEFVCTNCNAHVAYSDSRIIKFYRKTDINEEKRLGNLSFIEEPISVHYYTGTLDWATSAMGHYHSGTTTGSTW